ncbi:redoxin domain-containing protein [Nonomuraea sp. NPDC048882]|uniref:TlpA family protein disulfide reductase n=1 Tax=Nonomuraea sp. NPDC048882 TaxID=3154347 RepID=UPI0033C97E85
MSSVRTTAAMAMLVLLAAACGTAGQDETGPSAATATTVTSAPGSSPPASPAETTPAAGTAAVPAALRFSARTLDGQTFQGESLAGKPIAFWFWAPWCPKCLSEAPAVKTAAAQYDDVAFVGVASLDTEAAMKEFVQRTGTGDLVHLSDAKGAVWTKLGVSEQSTFVFMEPDGSTQKASGPLGRDKLDEHLRTLLGR